MASKMAFFDVKQLKALINILFLQGDNIHGSDAQKLSQAMADADYGAIQELIDKYATGSPTAQQSPSTSKPTVPPKP